MPGELLAGGRHATPAAMLDATLHARRDDGETTARDAPRLDYQSVLAGVVRHPAFLHHVAVLPLGVFDRLNDSHEGDVVTGARAAGGGGTNV